MDIERQDLERLLEKFNLGQISYSLPENMDLFEISRSVGFISQILEKIVDKSNGNGNRISAGEHNFLKESGFNNYKRTELYGFKDEWLKILTMHYLGQIESPRKRKIFLRIFQIFVKEIEADSNKKSYQSKFGWDKDRIFTYRDFPLVLPILIQRLNSMGSNNGENLFQRDFEYFKDFSYVLEVLFPEFQEEFQEIKKLKKSLFYYFVVVYASQFGLGNKGLSPVTLIDILDLGPRESWFVKNGGLK